MMHLATGTLLQNGRYRIMRFINSGGFGCTYEAVHQRLGKRVAIKEFFVRDFCNRDQTTGCVSVGAHSKRDFVAKLQEKFVDEAQALSAFQHPGIVKVYDVFEENGTSYFVMDYIEGRSLSEIVKQTGALPQHIALEYILQVADALDCVHKFNRLHLDIKPGNIMVDSYGKAILIDFGASKHYDEESGENTTTLLGVNSPGYAPVEQSTKSFNTFNPAADIYSLGATFYKLLSGITPPDSISLMSEVEELDKLPDSISKSIRECIGASMRFKSKDRPQNVTEFKRMLECAIMDETTLVSSKPNSTESTILHGDVQVVESFSDSERTKIDEIEGLEGDDVQDKTQVSPQLQMVEKIIENEYSSDKYNDEPERKSPSKAWLVLAGVAGLLVIMGICLLRNGSHPESNVANNDTFGAQSGVINGHEWVDLGLSVKWATHNVGGISPSDFGDYFAWGEIIPKSRYTLKNCQSNEKSLGDISGKPEYDAATAKWGMPWRMPTRQEVEELHEKCTWTWSSQNGIKGYEVTGANGNSIFLPAAGWIGTKHNKRGVDGFYWTSSPHGGNNRSAYYLYFENKKIKWNWRHRERGRSIRPVTG